MPLRYPDRRERRHEPTGYSSYSRYRDWLRDEFKFRCAYCLCRERFYPSHEGIFEIDHKLSKSEYPDLENDYFNLVYSCIRCNRRKGVARVPDPDSVDYSSILVVDSNGIIEPTKADGELLVDLLDLNSPELVEFRKNLFQLASNSRTSKMARESLVYALRFPDDLPDLSKKSVANKRTEGILESYFYLRNITKSLSTCYI